MLRAASLVNESNNAQSNTNENNEKLINELNSLNLDDSSSSKNETASANNAANDLIDFGFEEPTVTKKFEATNADEDEDLRLALKLQEEEEVH